MESRQDTHSQTKKVISSVYNYLKVLAIDKYHPEFAIFSVKLVK